MTQFKKSCLDCEYAELNDGPEDHPEDRESGGYCGFDGASRVPEWLWCFLNCEDKDITDKAALSSKISLYRYHINCPAWKPKTDK